MWQILQVSGIFQDLPQVLVIEKRDFDKLDLILTVLTADFLKNNFNVSH